MRWLIFLCAVPFLLALGFTKGDPEPLKPLKEGTDHRRIRKWLNELLKLGLQNRLVGGAGLKIEVHPDGTTVGALTTESFWIKLTSGGGASSKYAWTLVLDATGGGWTTTTLTGTTSTDPAYEINGNTTLTTFPYYVRAWRGTVTGEVRFLANPCP